MCLAVRACGRAEVAWRWEGCRAAACAAANIVVVVFYILLELLWYFGCMRPWPGSVSLTHVVLLFSLIALARAVSVHRSTQADAGPHRSAAGRWTLEAWLVLACRLVLRESILLPISTMERVQAPSQKKSKKGGRDESFGCRRWGWLASGCAHPHAVPGIPSQTQQTAAARGEAMRLAVGEAGNKVGGTR